MKTEELVTIRTLDSTQQANMYKSILESNGVAAYLAGDIVHDVLPLGIDMGVELQVAAEDEAEARRILNSKFDREEFKQGTSGK